MSYLERLKKFYSKHQRMPSLSELARVCGFASKYAARYWVNKWQKRGLIKRDLTGRLIPGIGFDGLKLLGTVQAGWPSPAEEEMTDTISLDEWLVRNKESCFMLTVSGDSMIEAGIHPGDVVILDRSQTPKQNDIVVAEVDREWTVKYFDKKNGKVRLRPANKNYKIIIPKEELRLAGVVTAVIRKYKR